MADAVLEATTMQEKVSVLAGVLEKVARESGSMRQMMMLNALNLKAPKATLVAKNPKPPKPVTSPRLPGGRVAIEQSEQCLKAVADAGAGAEQTGGD